MSSGSPLFAANIRWTTTTLFVTSFCLARSSREGGVIRPDLPEPSSPSPLAPGTPGGGGWADARLGSGPRAGEPHPGERHRLDRYRPAMAVALRAHGYSCPLRCPAVGLDFACAIPAGCRIVLCEGRPPVPGRIGLRPGLGVAAPAATKALPVVRPRAPPQITTATGTGLQPP